MKWTWKILKKRNRQEQIDLGVNAGALLSNESFKTAMHEIEEHYCELWKETKHPDDREMIWITLQNLKRLKVQLDAYYSDYKVNSQNDKIKYNHLKKVL